MFQVLNSGDVWLPEPGIGHALPMSLEAGGGGGEEPFSQTDARCLGWAARHVGAVQEGGEGVGVVEALTDPASSSQLFDGE